jgi:hypothetical protein
MTHYFLNEDHSVTPCDFSDWAEQFEAMSHADTRHVGSDMVNENHVSTVWLGLDHQWGMGGRPLIFETMVFKGDSCEDIYMDRYSTWDEAVEGHKRAIQWVKEGAKYDEE